MPEPIFIDRNGHRTWLKWHRGRKTGSDPVFTGRRILEGMRLGASVEVDLVIHKDRGYAVLHDEIVDRETTGHGPVADLSANELRLLFLRDNAGHPIDQHVMLLEDLCALIAQSGAHPDALLQLDYKLDAAALDARAIESFRKSVAPVARHMILSSGDAEAVRVLTEATPNLRVGYDPCHEGSLVELDRTRDFAGFTARAIADSPRAELIYLEYRVVLEARRAGFDIVEAFHQAGRRIDAYTIKVADETTRETVEGLLACKVDQITTDDPMGMMALAG